jgi:hypothetical protein
MNGENYGRKELMVYLGIAAVTLIAIAFLTLRIFDKRGGIEIMQKENIEARDSTIIHGIRQHSKLYTAEATAKKTVTYTSNNKLSFKFAGFEKDINLPLGKTKVTIPVSVTYKAYIDLERVTMHNIDIIDKKNIAIILPDPVLVETAVNIDHSNEKMDKEIFGKKLTHEKYRELVRDAKKQAWDELPEEDQRAIIERAKLSATELLIPQLKALGFENIVIDYSKNFSLRDMVREKL